MTRFDPDVVVVVLAGQVLGDWQVGGDWVHLCDPAYDAWYPRQIARRRVDPDAAATRVVLVSATVVHPAVGPPRERGYGSQSR